MSSYLRQSRQLGATVSLYSFVHLTWKKNMRNTVVVWRCEINSKSTDKAQWTMLFNTMAVILLIVRLSRFVAAHRLNHTSWCARFSQSYIFLLSYLASVPCHDLVVWWIEARNAVLNPLSVVGDRLLHRHTGCGKIHDTSANKGPCSLVVVSLRWKEVRGYG